MYRHFPTRGRLVLEVYRQEVQQLVEVADQLLDGSAPADALREWVDRLAQYAMTKHGLASALGSATGSGTPLYAETYEPDRRRAGQAACRPARKRARFGRGSTRTTSC